MRHLACHIYPRKHGTWRRTTDQLRRRWEFFTGKRVIAVATDDSTDSVEEVAAELPPDAELIPLANDGARREGASHKLLLERLSGLPGSTLLCHGKGSTHQADSVCQRWADVLWSVCCDYPELIDCALERFPVAGCFRRFGWLNVDWHFSGSFCWFRNADVFRLDWKAIASAWYSIETWPAFHFNREQSCCLFLDNAGDLYDSGYWERSVEPAFRCWQDRLRLALRDPVTDNCR